MPQANYPPFSKASSSDTSLSFSCNVHKYLTPRFLCQENSVQVLVKEILSVIKALTSDMPTISELERGSDSKSDAKQSAVNEPPPLDLLIPNVAFKNSEHQLPGTGVSGQQGTDVSGDQEACTSGQQENGGSVEKETLVSSQQGIGDIDDHSQSCDPYEASDSNDKRYPQMTAVLPEPDPSFKDNTETGAAISLRMSIHPVEETSEEVGTEHIIAIGASSKTIYQETGEEDINLETEFEKGTFNNEESFTKNMSLAVLAEEIKEIYISNYPFIDINRKHKEAFIRASANVKNIHFLDFENLSRFFMNDDLYHLLDMANSIILLVINATFNIFVIISRLEKKYYDIYKNLKENNKLFIVRAVGIGPNAADLCLSVALIDRDNHLPKDIDFFLHSNDSLFKDFKKCDFFKRRNYLINSYPNKRTITTEIQTNGNLQYFEIDKDVFGEFGHIIFWNIEKNIDFFEDKENKERLDAIGMDNFLILLFCNANYDIPDLKLNNKVVVLRAQVILPNVFDCMLEIMKHFHKVLPINVYFTPLSDNDSFKKVNNSKDFKGRRITRNKITKFNYYDIKIYLDKNNKTLIRDPIDPFETNFELFSLVQTIKCTKCEVMPKIINYVLCEENKSSEIGLLSKNKNKLAPFVQEMFFYDVNVSLLNSNNGIKNFLGDVDFTGDE